jgi:hypothetical protein
MLNKAISILGVLFMLMMTATMTFANDQLTGGAAGANTTASTFNGYIVRLEWFSPSVTQLRMVVKSKQAMLQKFIVNSETRIDINGRLAGPTELSIGDVVSISYGQNNIATKVSVKRPAPANVIQMAVRIQEIRVSGPSYVFVMQSMSGAAHFYELIVTSQSQLWRNGKLSDPSEFVVGDSGTVRFYLDTLKIVNFIAISPQTN